MIAICLDCGKVNRFTVAEARGVEVHPYFHGHGLKGWGHRLACDCGGTVFEIVRPGEQPLTVDPKKQKAAPELDFRRKARKELERLCRAIKTCPTPQSAYDTTLGATLTAVAFGSIGLISDTDTADWSTRFQEAAKRRDPSC